MGKITGFLVLQQITCLVRITGVENLLHLQYNYNYSKLQFSILKLTLMLIEQLVIMWWVLPVQLLWPWCVFEPYLLLPHHIFLPDPTFSEKLLRFRGTWHAVYISSVLCIKSSWMKFAHLLRYEEERRTA